MMDKDYNYKNPEHFTTCRTKKRTNRKATIVKRVGALTLSAVLFGSVAAGSFQAENHTYEKYTSSNVSDSTSIASSTGGLLKTSSGTIGTAGNLDVSAIAETAMPFIVSITNKSVQEVESFFSQFGYGYAGVPQTQETQSCGSGIIIEQTDDSLLIVTNNHVVEDADTLTVCFIDQEACDASIVGTDSTNDLAVISVPLNNISEDTLSQISVSKIGDSNSLKVGEQVVAIGNALGYGQSVTTGIISAVNRSISSDTDDSQTYIQTDAAINPGNSGGALLNMNGEVIGINSAKLASTEVEGMGYAIPMSKAASIIENLINGGGDSSNKETVNTSDYNYDYDANIRNHNGSTPYYQISPFGDFL